MAAVEVQLVVDRRAVDTQYRSLHAASCKRVQPSLTQPLGECASLEEAIERSAGLVDSVSHWRCKGLRGLPRYRSSEEE